MSQGMTVDHDLLADYVGGALEGTPEHERVAALIATSPEWEHAAEELTAALHDVQHDLNVFRESAEPMPDDVAARFEGLFDGARRDPLEAHVVTPRSGRRSRASAPGAPRRKAWKRWTAPIAIAAVALGLFGIGQVPSMVEPAMDAGSANNARLSEEAAPGAAPPAPVPTAATGQMYARDELQQTLPAVPFSRASAGVRQQNSTDKAAGSLVAPQLQRLTDPVALQQCLNAVTAVRPGRVDLVDYAYFEGSPALVITITSTSGQWVFVAGGNCGQPGPDEKFQTPLK